MRINWDGIMDYEMEICKVKEKLEYFWDRDEMEWTDSSKEAYENLVQELRDFVNELD